MRIINIISLLIFVLLTISNCYSQSCPESEILYASNPAVNDFFGTTVDLDGDRIAIFASTDNGTVYIYDLVASSWVETIITSSDAALDDSFGFGLSVYGDRIVAGAHRDDDNGSASGSAYIFDYSGSTWVETKLTASDGQAGDQFGTSVGVYGDRIVIGAFLDQDNGINSGSIYVFDWNGSNWVETKITASDAQAGDLFGREVAIHGDRFITNGRASTQGAVYVYDWNGSTWDETIVTSTNAVQSDYFGLDLDLDTNRFVAGAVYDTDNGEDSGSIYIFDWNGSTWVETKIIASDGEAKDFFGQSVGVSGDRVITGSSGEDDNGSSAGAAYLYEWDGSSWIEDKFYASNAAAHSSFGKRVEISGDRIICSATRTTNIFNNDGSAYIFDCCTDVFYEDADNDGFGNVNVSVVACSTPSGFVIDNTDCDDNNPMNFPGNIEVCDGQDNNCDDQIDEGLLNTYYADNDNDNYGDLNNSTQACSVPVGYVTDNTDCDDSDPMNFPGNIEICDGQDNNCDGQTDEGCMLPPCDGVNLQVPNVFQDTIRAEIHLESGAVINNAQPILFTSGIHMDLISGFEVSLGTIFEAKIEPCDNN